MTFYCLNLALCVYLVYMGFDFSYEYLISFVSVNMVYCLFEYIFLFCLDFLHINKNILVLMFNLSCIFICNLIFPQNYFILSIFGFYYITNIVCYKLGFPEEFLIFNQYRRNDFVKNYGFSTPLWDILFYTSSHIPIEECPLCLFPIPFISFLTVEEIIIISDFLYLIPCCMLFNAEFYIYSFYFLCIFVSSLCKNIKKAALAFNIAEYIVFYFYYLFIIILFWNYDKEFETLLFIIISLISVHTEYIYMCRLVSCVCFSLLFGSVKL